jgi:hypothetical protein
MSGNSLVRHIELTRELRRAENITITEIEDMAVWERDFLLNRILREQEAKNTPAMIGDGGYKAMLEEMKK